MPKVMKWGATTLLGIGLFIPVGMYVYSKLIGYDLMQNKGSVILIIGVMCFCVVVLAVGIYALAHQMAKAEDEAEHFPSSKK